MSIDPQRDEQLKRQRLMMLLLMIPWFILMYMWTKNAQQSQETRQREALLEARGGDAIDAAAPIDDQIFALRAKIEADPKSEESDLNRLRVAVLLESDRRYQEAAEEYERFAKERKSSPYVAHATYHAARLYRQLGDERRFAKLLSAITFDYNRAIWDHKAVGNRDDKQPAAVVAARELDPHNQHDVRYKLLAFLVGLFDPEKHPEYAYAAGVALLGFIVKVMVWPLTSWSSRASKVMSAKMKLIQPQIAELREKYKDDQMKVMREQQELMRKYQISMRSGCLPALISMAILIPIYQAVRLYAYPLQQGRFLWIDNLASPDLGLLVIYVAAFFVSMKLQPQPASADPQQQQTQKMMTAIMPVMFFFLMRSVASAFVLYWTVFLIFSTVQSLWLNYQWQKTGGDQAVFDRLPDELKVKPRRSPRKERGKTDVGTEGKRDGKPAGPSTKPVVVERLGEEIQVAPQRPKGFIERLFAPALSQSTEPGNGTSSPAEEDGAAEEEVVEAAVLSEDSGSGTVRALDAEERRARRKAKRREARQAKARTS